MIEDHLLTNVSLGKTAVQSSLSVYSRPDDAKGAVDGHKSGGFGFHTDFEINPWWMVDLDELHRIHKIIIYNRDDTCRVRAKALTVLVAEVSAGPWLRVYEGLSTFGGAVTGTPLVLNLDGAVSARWVKIQLNGFTALHLDEVEVYAYAGASAYRDGILRFKEPRSLAHTPSSEGAIVCLTRGYEDVSLYEPLMRRNLSIYEALNKHRTVQYPLIIWHEGNISSSHQQFILAREKNADTRFIDISDLMALPAESDTATFLEQWPLGYRLMCRFHTSRIWDLVSDFRYVMRVDEDCFLNSTTVDPIEWARAEAIDFGASLYIEESHALTNSTLSEFVDVYARSEGLAGPDSHYYNQDFPYTNVYVARTGFFSQPAVRRFLNAISNEPDSLCMRWGDLPALGVALNMFARTDRVAVIPGLAYEHGSHEVTVANANGNGNGWAGIPSARRTTLNSDVAAYFYGQARAQEACGDYNAAETAHLKALAAEPRSPMVTLGLGSVSSCLGRHEIAVKLLKDGLSRAASRLILPAHHFRLATSLHSLGQFEDAIRQYAAMFTCDISYQAAFARGWISSFAADNRAIFWTAPDGTFAADASIRGIFDLVYDRDIWGGGSGVGSDMTCTAIYAGLVQHLISSFAIRRIVDIGCGDWRFSRYIDFGEAEYLGVDIVASVVEANNQAYGTDRIRFERVDATIFDLDECDLVLCKDVLQHLSNDNIFKILRQLSKASMWLITNDFWPVNEDCRNGDTRPLSLTAAPFSIAAQPILAFNSKVSFLYGTPPGHVTPSVGSPNAAPPETRT